MTSYASPNFTQVPHLIIDSLMATMPNGAFKCMMVIFRHTLGWQRRIDKISISTFMKKTGLSRQGVIDSIEYIEEEGLAVVHREGTKTNIYEVLIEDICEKFKNKELVNSVDQASQLSRQALVNSVDQFSESLKKEERKIKTNKPEAPPSSEVVRSFRDDLLKKTKLTTPQRMKINKDFLHLDDETFKSAIEAFFAYAKKKDITRYMGTLISALGGYDRGTPWTKTETAEDIALENKEKVHELLGKYDEKEIGKSVKWRVVILRKCIEFTCGSTAKTFDYDARDFKMSINGFLEKIKIDIKF